MLVPIMAVTSMYATIRERMLQTDKAFVQISTSYQAIMRSKLSISSVVARIPKGI